MRKYHMFSYRYKTESFFFTSVFFSSLGTLLFQFCFAIFALSKGWSIVQVGIAIGVSRLVQIISMSVLGDKGDKKNPQTLLICSELAGAILNALIALFWKLDSEFVYFIILALVIFRSSIISLQIPLRAKISKLLANDLKSTNHKFAILLNIATQGTVLFAAILSLFFYRYSNFYWVLLIDTLSFLFSGIVIWKLKIFKENKFQKNTIELSIWDKFKHYYRVNAKLFWIDIILNIPVCGTQALFIRLAFKNSDTFGVLWMLYGTAAILTAPIVNKYYQLWRNPILWICLGFGFIMLGKSDLNSFSSILICGFIYFFYWILAHALDAEYQAETNSNYFAAVTAVRNITAIGIISIGEILVSLGASFWSISLESLIRGLISILVGLFIFVKLKAPTMNVSKV